jgi:hypothetical protein
MNITEPVNPGFPQVYLIDFNDDVIGGEEGISNRQAKQLVERTAYLKKTMEAADGDLQDQIDGNTAKINAVKGRGGYLIAHDFGTHTPSQDDLNAYALSQIHSEDPLDIWNGTHVKNIYVDPATVDETHPDGIPDNHVWALTNTPDTDPPIHEWVDDGFDSVSEFSNDFAGVLQGTADPGDGSKNGFVTALPGGFARIIGDIATMDRMYPVGSSYIQYADDPAPVERNLPGIWELWNYRADIYGLSMTVPGYSVYTPGASYAVNAYVLNHRDGGDFRLYKAKEAVTGAPQYLDPVKWTPVEPGMRIERRHLQGWGDDDFEIGDELPDGTYAGMFVSEVIVPGGKFPSFDGEFRPPFISGGVMGDQIRDASGQVPYFPQSVQSNWNGVFYTINWPSNDVSMSGGSN